MNPDCKMSTSANPKKKGGGERGRGRGERHGEELKRESDLGSTYQAQLQQKQQQRDLFPHRVCLLTLSIYFISIICVGGQERKGRGIEGRSRRERIRNNSGVGGEEGTNKDADVADVDGEMQRVHYVVHEARSRHQSFYISLVTPPPYPVSLSLSVSLSPRPSSLPLLSSYRDKWCHQYACQGGTSCGHQTS